MSYVTALLTLFVRLFRPTRGAHTTPFGYLYELGAEVHRRRSRRVRRYVRHLAPSQPASTAHSSKASPEPDSPTPPIPAPRRPSEDLHPQVEIVRGPYRNWETRQALLQGAAG